MSSVNNSVNTDGPDLAGPVRRLSGGPGSGSARAPDGVLDPQTNSKQVRVHLWLLMNQV